MAFRIKEVKRLFQEFLKIRNQLKTEIKIKLNQLKISAVDIPVKYRNKEIQKVIKVHPGYELEAIRLYEWLVEQYEKFKRKN